VRRVVRWLRSRRSTLFELAGFALFTVATARFSVELGLFVAGLGCLNFAYQRPRRRRGEP
jgi:hypothetical protein